jgi:hypothetical protein
VANKTCITAATALLALASIGSAQQFFTDRAAFLANVQSDHYEETFEGWSEGNPLDGHQDEWEGPGANGLGWSVSAPGSGNHQLYSLYSAISTSSHNDALSFQLSGNPVYAFGGDFWGTQYDGFPLTAAIQFETDTGQQFVHEVSGRSFLGIISNVPLTNVTITAAAGAASAWPTADSIITGALNPDGDLDGDGMTNSDELLAGTDPGDPKSNLRITASVFDDSAFVVSFLAVAAKTYRLEYKEALGDAAWLPTSVADYTAASTGTAQFTDPLLARPSQNFYRVRVVLPSSPSLGMAKSSGRAFPPFKQVEDKHDQGH